MQVHYEYTKHISRTRCYMMEIHKHFSADYVQYSVFTSLFTYSFKYHDASSFGSSYLVCSSAMLFSSATIQACNFFRLFSPFFTIEVRSLQSMCVYLDENEMLITLFIHIFLSHAFFLHSV